MNVDIAGLPAPTTRTQTQESRQDAVPQAVTQSVPGTAAALPVAETALRHVLASRGSGSEDPAAAALDLLRSVEALLRASTPDGMSAEDLGAAAAQLVERQGLLARLSPAHPAPPTPATDPWSGTASDVNGPSAVDTRL